MSSLFLQAIIYLGAAVIAVPVAKRLGMGSVLGYLIAGIVIGPVIGRVGGETAELQHFAEFGVVMMLFVVGLELEPKALWDMRHRLVGLGGLQITLTTGLISAGAYLFGMDWPVALAIGLIFSLSSTAIVIQTLHEKNLMHEAGGRSAFSVLLTQDIAVIPMLTLLPLLALSGIHNEGALHAGNAHGSMSLIEGLPGWAAAGATLAAVAAVVLGGHVATRALFRFIAAARLREMFTAATLLLVIGIAFLMSLVGLSPALGTFLAGVVLANSEFRHELESDIEPFKGLLLGLFFITVGAGIEFATLYDDFARIAGATLGVMIAKALILLLLAQIFGLTGRDRVLFTLGLAQAGEFGFVLIGYAVQTNVLPLDLSAHLLLIVALSMLLTPALFILFDLIAKHHRDARGDRPADEIDAQHPIILAGAGRFGQVVNRMLAMNGLKATVLDHDIEVIRAQRKFGLKGFYGDPTRPELLQAAGLMTAEVLVVALDDHKAAVRLVAVARAARPDLHIIARARDRGHVYELYAAGANQMVRETFDSSIRVGKYVLKRIGIPAYEVDQAASDFFDLDRDVVKEMASLWDPNVPAMENAAFMKRAREYNEALVTSFADTEDDR
jgi:CPA2 family monovalent cation:H+ antiporter-2